MKLIVTIPAYNEESTISEVIKQVPRRIEGIDEVFVLVINDGSTDSTTTEASQAGADKIINKPHNTGLADTFRIGLKEALSLGADIVVNTDADNQYNQTEINKLIEPILQNKADIVIGDRQVGSLSHMRKFKKYGNLIGSYLVGILSGIKGLDASSGFRAITQEAAMKLNIYFDHTYTHQAIIEAAYKRISITSVPVEFRPRDGGESRLIKSIFQHVRLSLFIIIRTLLVYKALRTFVWSGSVLISLGALLGFRFLYYYFILNESGKVQSLILASILIMSGVIMYVIGFLADLIAVNRRMNEDALYLLKKREYKK